MRAFCVSELVICIILAVAAINASAAEYERGGLDDIHEELAAQLRHEDHAGISGEELAGKLQENQRDLNEMEREIVQQLIEEQLASMTGQELARILLTKQQQFESQAVDTRGAGCSVSGFSAHCCAGTSFKVIFKTVSLNACVLAEFLPEEIGIRVKISVSGLTILDQKISARNPGGVCVKIPEVPLVSLCLVFSDLQVSSGRFSGCLAFKPKTFGITVVTLNLGCIHIP